MGNGMPKITKEESEKIQAMVLREHADLACTVSESMHWYVNGLDYSQEQPTGWEAVVERMWEMSSIERMVDSDLSLVDGCKKLFFMGLLLASAADPKKRSSFELVPHLRRVLQERGSDYGSLVLVELGFDYTYIGIRAKLLRIINKMRDSEELLFDECLDIAGYAVLHMAVFRYLR